MVLNFPSGNVAKIQTELKHLPSKLNTQYFLYFSGNCKWNKMKNSMQNVRLRFVNKSNLNNVVRRMLTNRL